MSLPAPIDPEALLQRLAQEEKRVAHHLARLEGRIHDFENLERPAYGDWIRLELGPLLSLLEEITSRIHVQRALVKRVDELIQTQGLHPRVALYVAMNPTEEVRGGDRSGQMDEERVKARRQAKLEAKRAARKEKKKEKRRAKARVASSAEPLPPGDHPQKKKLLALYRELARKLHPDSPHLIQDLPASRVRSLWHEVQAAYVGKQLERLLAIMIWLTDRAGETPSSAGAISVSERFERLRALKRACSKLAGHLSQLEKDPAWNFKAASESKRRKLRQAATRDLEKEIAETQDILDMLNDFIESLGPPKPPKKR